MAREISLIVIHCSASKDGESLFSGRLTGNTLQTPLQVINNWHRARGFHRAPEWRSRFNPSLDAIGYHFVIYVSGTTATGRHVNEIGAHCYGHNRQSIGVCMIGTDRFLPAQWEGLKATVLALQKKYPAARVAGHRDLSPDVDGDGIIEPQEWLKTCPGFDVAAWLARDMASDPLHVFQPAQGSTA